MILTHHFEALPPEDWSGQSAVMHCVVVCDVQAAEQLENRAAQHAATGQVGSTISCGDPGEEHITLDTAEIGRFAQQLRALLQLKEAGNRCSLTPWQIRPLVFLHRSSNLHASKQVSAQLCSSTELHLSASAPARMPLLGC